MYGSLEDEALEIAPDVQGNRCVLASRFRCLRACPLRGTQAPSHMVRHPLLIDARHGSNASTMDASTMFEKAINIC